MIKRVKSSIYLFLITLLTGCGGYVPISRYAKAVFPDPVYVKVYLSGAEPQYGVYIKDEINRVLLTHFHNRITNSKELSMSQLYVTNYKIKYEPLTYDTDGFVTRYRVSINISFKLHTKETTLQKDVSSTEEVSIQTSSLLSSLAKESAIKTSIRKAMDKFIALIAKEGYLRK